MRLNHNIASLNTFRQLSQGHLRAGKSLEKLSSGLRINRAGDDAAGLAISEKMRGQIRGLAQASRNIQDGISLIQTAEGGLNEVHSLLQRGRALAVQAANDTNTSVDRESIQKEIDQLTQEIDQLTDSTEFNTIKLLNVAPSNDNQQEVLNNLKRGWLAASEALVQDTLGIGGMNEGLRIVLRDTIDGTGNTAALVSYSYTPGVPGTGDNLELHLDMRDFENATYPNGGTGIAYDRIIAHEMTHAAMAASVNISTDMQTWFMEGVAEAVHGADERLASSLTSMTAQQLADRVGTGTSGWGGSSDDYSMAYASVRYMDYLIATNGGTGVKDIITYMAADTTRTLNDALASNAALAAVGVTDIASFATKFRDSGTGGGIEYINQILVPKLSNADTGSILGADRITSLSSRLVDQSWTSSGPGSTNVNSNSSTDSVELTYAYSGGLGSQTWDFHTTATNSESIKFNWSYSWFHSWYMASGNARAYVDGTGGRTYFNLGSGSGNLTLNVNAGYSYGIELTGSHSDSARQYNGTFTINQVPSPTIKDNLTVVDESPYGTMTDDPLSTYGEIWPTITSNSNSKLSIQIGANSGQHMEVSRVDAHTSSLGISGIDVFSNDGLAITKFDEAIQTVSGFRATLGAIQRRLEKAMEVAHNSVENLTASESRIRDVDMAKEMMTQTKNSILSQVAQAMLAQANLQPQGVLQLLR